MTEESRDAILTAWRRIDTYSGLRPARIIIRLRTNDSDHSLEMPPWATGFGSGANGGGLLLVALDTYYCSDIYGEAAQRSVEVERVEVEEEGDFPAEGAARSGKKSTLMSMASRAKARPQRARLPNVIRPPVRSAKNETGRQLSCTDPPQAGG